MCIEVLYLVGSLTEYNWCNCAPYTMHLYIALSNPYGNIMPIIIKYFEQSFTSVLISISFHSIPFHSLISLYSMDFDSHSCKEVPCSAHSENSVLDTCTEFSRNESAQNIERHKFNEIDNCTTQFYLYGIVIIFRAFKLGWRNKRITINWHHKINVIDDIWKGMILIVD